MATRRLIRVQENNPLSTARGVLRTVWETNDLQGMFVPVWEDDEPVPTPRWIDDPERLDAADPFAPFMLQNSAGEVAKDVPEIIRPHYCVFLRPCEIQSLRQIAEVKSFDLSPLLILSSDCLSVFPEDYFIERSSRAAHREEATLEMLHFASQGGILPSRYKLACQLCEHPFPIGVDLHFEIIGHPTSQFLIIECDQDEMLEALAAHHVLESVPRSVEFRREETLARLENWRGKSLWATSASVDRNMIGAAPLLDHLTTCEPCRQRLEAHCPLFIAWDPADPGADRLIEGWVRSCGGCGMCEHVCPEGYPLFKVITAMRTAPPPGS
jgi:ferredoxin